MKGFALLHPQALWLLGALGAIVLLYVLKARRRRMVVPSIWLWATSQRDLQVRAPFRKLRRELPLVLDLAAMALLALALAAPSCRGRSIVGSHVAIVIDTSASMGAIDPHTQRPRSDQAQRELRRLIDGLALGSDAMLVAAGHEPRVVFALGRDRDALRRAAASVAPEAVEGDLRSAIGLGLDRLRPLTGTRRVFVVTDGGGRAENVENGAIPVQLIRVGAPEDNAGIVRMDVRSARDSSGAETVQIFALVANDGTAQREVYVTARRDGANDIVASRRVLLAPAAREPIVLSFPLAPADVGRGVVVDMSPHDALAADDVAYGRIPPSAQLPIVLVSRDDDPWIARAIEADPNAQLRRAAPGDLGSAPAGSLIVFDGLCPDPLPTGHDVLVFAPPVGRCAGTTVLPAVDAPVITSYEHTDPRFRFLTMDGVNIARATPLRLGPDASDILHANALTLVADASSPEHEVTIVGLDVRDSDWPLRASFVLFIRNVEEIARAHRARAVAGGGRTGEPLRIAVPVGVRSVEAMTPTRRVRVAATAGTAVLGDTTVPGLYRFSWTGGDTIVPVNLLSDAESDLRSVAPASTGRAAIDASGTIRPHQELTPWIALLASAFLLANLLWLTRPERVPRPRGQS